MTTRLDWFKAAPGVAKALFSLQPVIADSGLEHSLLELVKLRASQINGCAFCIDMHWKDARAAGETEQRLFLLESWREAAHLYSARERAAIAWTEAITRIGTVQVPDDVYEEAVSQFAEDQLVKLTFAITTTHAWNRLNVAFHRPAGDYVPGMFKNLRTA